VDGRERSAAVPAALLSTVMRSVSGALVLTDRLGVVVTANPAFELLTGLGSEDITGCRLSELVAPGQDPAVRSARSAVKQGHVWQGDVTIVKGDGSPLSLRVKTTPVLDGQQVSHLVIEVRDSSNTRLLSELDPAAQTLGRLSSSIAHDFNNQLSVIINYTHILSRQIGKESTLQSHLHDMQTTAWRASKLAQQLIVLGRRTIAEPQRLDVNKTIGTLAPLLQTLVGDRVKLTMTLEQGLWPVHMALPQVEQVLINLAVNAREAMQGVGELELATSNVTLSEDDLARPADLAAGKYVRLTVNERAALSAHATATPVDATTPLAGLGPSMIYRAIEQAGGSLALVANDEGGTAFRIHLPAHTTESIAPEPTSEIRTLS